MNKVLINNELNLTLPDGFTRIGEEEVRKNYSSATENIWGAKNPDAHRSIFVLWKKVNRLLAAIADPGASVKKTESDMKKLLESKSYRLDGFFTKDLKIGEVHGFSYEYKTEDVTQCATTAVLKHKGNIYTVNFYSRKGSGSTSDDFDSILESLSFN